MPTPFKAFRNPLSNFFFVVILENMCLLRAYQKRHEELLWFTLNKHNLLPLVSLIFPSDTAAWLYSKLCDKSLTNFIVWWFYITVWPDVKSHSFLDISAKPASWCDNNFVACHYLILFLSFRPLPRRYYWKTCRNGSLIHQKRGTLTVARSRFEVFELTRHIETSNEDPTPYVYSTPYLYQKDIIWTSYYIPMSIYRCMVSWCDLKCSKFQSIKTSANKRFYHYVSPLPTATFKWLRRGACKTIHLKAYNYATQI